MIFNGLTLDKEYSIIVAREHHVCESCLRKYALKNPNEDKAAVMHKLAGKLTGQKVHKILSIAGQDVVICNDCLKRLAELTDENAE